MRGEVYINELDAWSYYGVVLDEGSEEALLLPSPLKSFTSNDMRSHHGKQVFTNNPRLKDRTVSLTFCFLWAEDYMEKYNRFVEMLQQGSVVLSTKIMGTKMTFNLVYNSCRKYTSIQYAGKIIVNFEEPNPANRLTGNPIDVFAPKISALGGDSNNTIHTYKQLDPLIKNDAVTILFPTVIESGVVYGMNNISGDIVRFPFSRNSQATYFDKDINMHLAPVNMPRIDYKNYGDRANILIEREAANMILDSGLKKTTDQVAGTFHRIDSDWFNFFDKVILTPYLESGGSFYYKNLDVTESNSKYTYSSYIKSSSENRPKIGTSNEDDTRLVIDQGLNFTSSFSELKDNIFRIVTTKSGRGSRSQYGFSKLLSQSTNDISFVGFQCELGESSTSYIPTESTIVTRAADKLSYFIFGDCSVYLKTTKQNVVFDKSTGLWNIESDLNNEGIITLAIFDRILTATEKAQLTQIK